MEIAHWSPQKTVAYVDSPLITILIYNYTQKQRNNTKHHFAFKRESKAHALKAKRTLCIQNKKDGTRFAFNKRM